MQNVSLQQFKQLVPAVVSIQFHQGSTPEDKIFKLIFSSEADADNYIRNVKGFYKVDLALDPHDVTKKIVLLPKEVANKVYNRSLIAAVMQELLQQEKAEKKE